mmetsp:Transcript_40114/g.92163  ORF Transcript_40114/g.92163 Transcript_40114/m.92163 type:complete len:299 (-) Transcript_40114:139-1035(-)
MAAFSLNEFAGIGVPVEAGDGGYGPVRTGSAGPSASGPYGSAAGGLVIPDTVHGMVQKIKEIQRTSPEDKQRWINWCESNSKTKHDPALHDEAFLRLFFEALQVGSIPGQPIFDIPGGPGGLAGSLDSKDHMVQKIKVMQRNDPKGKALWIHYCEQKGEKKHDPALHDEAFLAVFLEDYESGVTVPQEVGDKLKLVQRIKDMQRNDPGGKQCWIMYCESQGYTKHDPNFYPPEFLSGFVDIYEGTWGSSGSWSTGSGGGGGKKYEEQSWGGGSGGGGSKGAWDAWGGAGGDGAWGGGW